MVVVAVTWRHIYAPDGPLNDVLRAVGLDSVARGWLGDYTFALPAVGVIGTWFETEAGDRAAGRDVPDPRERYEAARLDLNRAVRGVLRGGAARGPG